jgi:hypothetical protein
MEGNPPRFFQSVTKTVLADWWGAIAHRTIRIAAQDRIWRAIKRLLKIGISYDPYTLKMYITRTMEKTSSVPCQPGAV